MTTTRTTQQWLEDLRQTPEYTAESLTIQLIVKCEDRRAELGWSYAELARRMGVTRAYIGKLMGGTQNSTVGSLVKLTEALGCKLSLDATWDVQKNNISTASARSASRHLVVTPSKPSGRATR